MTRHERDECMRYVGQLEGILAIIAPVEGEYEEDTTIIFNKLNDIKNDLECLVKGYDRFDVTKFMAPVDGITSTSGPIEGGDDDDV